MLPALITSACWWRRLDSNQRRRKPTDLQSAPFSHSGTPPQRICNYGDVATPCQHLPRIKYAVSMPAPHQIFDECDKSLIFRRICKFGSRPVFGECAPAKMRRRRGSAWRLGHCASYRMGSRDSGDGSPRVLTRLNRRSEVSSQPTTMSGTSRL